MEVDGRQYASKYDFNRFSEVIRRYLRCIR